MTIGPRFVVVVVFLDVVVDVVEVLVVEVEVVVVEFVEVVVFVVVLGGAPCAVALTRNVVDRKQANKHKLDSNVLLGCINAERGPRTRSAARTRSERDQNGTRPG